MEAGKKDPAKVAKPKTLPNHHTDKTPRGNLLRDKTLEGRVSRHYRIADSAMLIYRGRVLEHGNSVAK